jgi:hypothetical protein
MDEVQRVMEVKDSFIKEVKCVRLLRQKEEKRPKW